MHNKISLWFIFYDSIDLVLKNISQNLYLTDDIHVYARNNIDKEILDILHKYNIRITYKKADILNYISIKSKYTWSLIIEENSYIKWEDINNIKNNIRFEVENLKNEEYILIKNIK